MITFSVLTFSVGSGSRSAASRAFHVDHQQQADRVAATEMLPALRGRFPPAAGGRAG